MGLCLSKCGEAHQKAAVVAASISTHGSSPSDPEHDPNHSLKKFLHLYDAVDKKTSTSGSARPSLEDSGSLGIPHSSELFSLHGEDSDSNSNRNSSSSPCNSPPRTSKGSAVSRSSISSRPNISSPHSTRNSVSARITAGRSSTDRPPLAPKGGNSNSKKRGSASSEDFNARKIFVETIAKLERFCNLEVSRVSQTSVGAEQIAQKLVVGLASFDQEDGSNPVGVQRCDSDPLGINSRGGLESAHSLIRSSSVASFKGLPYEKSVACFLREMESLVSTIEASGGLVVQSEVNPIPVAAEVEEEEEEEEEPRSMTRLPSLRFKDVDEKVQFTDFEASFDYSDGQSLLDVQVLVEEELNRHADGPSTSTEIANKPEKDASEASTIATCSACDLVEEATVENVALQDPNSQAEDISDWVEIDISSSATEEDQKAEKKPEASSSRPALTDLNVNIAVPHEAPAPKKSPSKMKPFKALRRGMSKSLDLKECSVGFDAFKRERLQVAKDQKSNIVQATNSRREETTGQGADKLAPEKLQCGEAKVATPEQESIAASERDAQEIENPGKAQNSQSNNMAGVISPFDLRLLQDLSSVPGHQRLEKPGSLDGCEGGLMWASSAGTIDLQNDSDSKRFLTKALGNILKLLHSPNGEFTRCSGKLLELLEAESATMKSTSTPQGSPAPGPSPVAGEDHDQDVGEDDDGDATLACEQDRWHDAPASLISNFNMEKLESKDPVPS